MIETATSSELTAPRSRPIGELIRRSSLSANPAASRRSRPCACGALGSHRADVGRRRRQRARASAPGRRSSDRGSDRDVRRRVDSAELRDRLLRPRDDDLGRVGEPRACSRTAPGDRSRTGRQPLTRARWERRLAYSTAPNMSSRGAGAMMSTNISPRISERSTHISSCAIDVASASRAAIAEPALALPVGKNQQVAAGARTTDCGDECRPAAIRATRAKEP